LSIESISALATAITSIIAILLAAYTFWFQTRQAKRTLGITIVREYERDFFNGIPMRQRRYRAARFLIDRSTKDIPPQACYEILDFFDAFGIYVNRGFIETDIAWITLYYWLGFYWHSLVADVEAFNKRMHGVTYLSNCEELYRRLTRYAERHQNLPNEAKRFAPEDVRQFLHDELAACADAVPEIERRIENAARKG
jgi:hypothetical protein